MLHASYIRLQKSNGNIIVLLKNSSHYRDMGVVEILFAGKRNGDADSRKVEATKKVKTLCIS